MRNRLQRSEKIKDESLRELGRLEEVNQQLQLEAFEMEERLRKKEQELEKVLDLNRKLKAVIKDRALKSKDFALSIEDNIVKEMDQSFK